MTRLTLNQLSNHYEYDTLFPREENAFVLRNIGDRGGRKRKLMCGLKLGTARDERNCFWAGQRRDGGRRPRFGEHLRQQHDRSWQRILPARPHARKVVSVEFSNLLFHSRPLLVCRREVLRYCSRGQDMTMIHPVSPLCRQ